MLWCWWGKPGRGHTSCPLHYLMTVVKLDTKEVTTREIMVAMIKVAREVTGYRKCKWPQQPPIASLSSLIYFAPLSLIIPSSSAGPPLDATLLYVQLIFLLYLKDLLKLFSLLVDDVKLVGQLGMGENDKMVVGINMG